MKKFVTFMAICTIVSVTSPANAKRDVWSDPDMKKYAKTATDLGWKYSEKGDYETAMERFRMAIRHNNKYAPAYYGMAYVHGLQGNLEESIAFYREAIGKNPKFSEAYASLGYSLLQRKRIPEGLKMLKKAISLNPRCVEAHKAYAGYYADHGMWAEAANSANLVTKYGGKLDPDFKAFLEANGAKLY